MNNNIKTSSKWTAEEEKYLYNNFGNLTFKAISKHLGKSMKAIERKVWRLGLSTGFDPANKTRWRSQEDEYLIENHLKLTYEEIGQHLNRSVKSVSGRIERLGIGQASFWTEEKDEFVRKYYGSITNKELARLIRQRFETDRSVKSISQSLGRRASLLGVSSNPFHSANSSFFEQPNTINSYYAGLIASDGCIDDSSSSIALKIELHHLDGSILEKFKKDTGFTGKVTRQNTRGYSIIQVSCCQQWFDDLERNFNITPRKSLTLRPPSLNRECSLAFLIGFIDGDGSVRIYKGRKPSLCISIFSTETVVNWAKQLISTLVIHHKKPMPKIRKMNSIFSFTMAGVRAEQVCRLLMKVQTPRLWRKWVLAKAWLEKDEEMIRVFLKGHGTGAESWGGVLSYLNTKNLSPKEYYGS